MNKGIKLIRDILATFPDSSGLPVEERRKQMDDRAAGMHLPRGFTVEGIDADGVQAEWVNLEGAPADRVLLYLHGGGYVVGSLVSHRQMIAYISRAAGASALSLAYRLAPEHPFPAAVEDAVTGYRWLIKQGFKPEKIAIAGDSAGGGLTMATLIKLRDSGDPLPACGICLSPWADLTGSSETYRTKAETDPMITVDGIQEMADMYLNGEDAKTPLASPVFADLTGLPPLLILVGSEEVLLDDSVELDRKAKTCGVDCTLQVWNDMIHVWPMFSPILQEGKDAIDRIGKFYKNHVQ
ncbi:MAG: alpha/beta hydrolase [Deltaproteobacteria bacterium]|nr:alpha/beta hydrolase [Deltaproteobacteria bacterium]